MSSLNSLLRIGQTPIKLIGTWMYCNWLDLRKFLLDTFLGLITQNTAIPLIEFYFIGWMLSFWVTSAKDVNNYITVINTKLYAVKC